MCVALLMLLPTIAAAQKVPPPPLPSTITVEIGGLNCTTPAGTGAFKVDSWTWGASNSSQVSGGATAGTANLQDLSVMKSFDACSPALLGLVTSGQVLKFVRLTQTASDQIRATTVLLEGVLVSSWNLSSSTAQQTPFESVSFNFRKVCVTDTVSGTTACFDSALVP